MYKFRVLCISYAMERTIRSDVIHTTNGFPSLGVSNLEFDVHSRYSSVAVETSTGIISFCSKGFRSADIRVPNGRRYCWARVVFLQFYKKLFFIFIIIIKLVLDLYGKKIFNRQMRNVRRKSNNNNGYERTLEIRDGETFIVWSPK